MTEIRGLGYLRIQTQDVARWRELVVDGLGLAVGSGPEADGLYLRLDERRARLIVLPGETDKALAVGWEVRDQFALQRVREAVEKAGVEVEVLSEVDASYRDAEQVIAFDDPNGNRVEVFFGPVLDHSPLVTPHGGRFVTGDQGLGHVVLPVTRFDEAYTFYTEVLGFLRAVPSVSAASMRRRRLAAFASWVSTSATTAWRCARRRRLTSPVSCT